MKHARLFLTSFSVICLITLSGCPTAPLPVEPQVSVRGTSAGIEIGNGSAERVFYAIAPMRLDPLLDLNVCTDPAVCQAVPGNSRVVITWPTSDVVDHEYRVYWWQARIGGGAGTSSAGVQWVAVTH